MVLLIMLFVFAFMLIIGIPIAFCLGLSSLAIVLIEGRYPIIIVAQKMFNGMDMFALMAIPLFILAGDLMNLGGITDRLIKFSNLLVGHIRGGLAHTLVVAEMFLSGVTGSAVADASALGSVMIPSMVKEGYDKEFSTAILATAATAGPIIPPSITMVVYGVTMGVSIGGLFLAGCLPGLIMGVSMMAMAYYFARKRNYPRNEKRATFRQIVKGSREAVAALILPVVILGGIMSGVFTATEAASIAVFFAFVFGFFLFRTLTLKDIPKILVNCAITTSIIMLIIGTANVTLWFLATQQVPQKVSTLFLSISTNPYVLLFIVNIILLIVGCFMETGAAIILFAPILAPILTGVGFHPLHVGFIFVFNLVIGMITPPLGVCLFVGCTIAKISLERLSKAIWPFILLLIGVLLIFSYFPGISMIIPKLFGYA
ncbi:MAG: C4-dicarboxylate ABC transporter permease [Deltaproteobacteria bacterium RBG_16_49_23]|nr:MAG: C4-dicarboxylate ABC transporter permease [Deltaproteobacteria bacterium RBG_16_49_23]